MSVFCDVYFITSCTIFMLIIIIVLAIIFVLKNYPQWGFELRVAAYPYVLPISFVTARWRI